MGDAAGIGPEVIVKALSNSITYQICQPIVIGSASILQDVQNFLSSNGIITEDGRPFPVINPVHSLKQYKSTYGRIDILDICTLQPEDFTYGTINPQTGKVSVEVIEKAVKLALDGELDGIVTAPICKAAIQQCGSTFPGHTEMLASLTHSEKTVMMLKTWNIEQKDENNLNKKRKKVKNYSTFSSNSIEDLTVTFVTNHIPISKITQNLSIDRITDVIQLTYETLMGFGIESPRIVVAGLNPHSGEKGMFGKEEEEYIIPAIQRVQSEELDVIGPLPADTLFKRAIQGEWDAVVAMYHDQGNIPIKMIGFGNIVNITLGLPIIRTSVDHGTAFDIAGQGIASETSLISALSAAAHLAKKKI
ncbi:4-hydroxythreonine-4-phosphate dehydrogenase PdxA [Candidatus Poribacteria bacterium]|nr:4-hydroxythreonine-4-phosphate dehydrogenase PdxA [Candidatus Poribacteria bacterium]